MHIFNARIVDTLPILEIKNALVIADLHLGYEIAMTEYGVMIPKVQLSEEVEMLKKAMEKSNANILIINGDLKHEFGRSDYHEYKEVKTFLEKARKHFEKIVVVKGNHDNYIENILKRFKNIEVCNEFEFNNFYFLHGHKETLKIFKKQNIVLAHEHPAILLEHEYSKEKIPCFLYGRIRGINIIVLPPFSSLAGGSEINILPKHELLSPILKQIDVDKLKAIGVSEAGLLKFPEIRVMRNVY